VKRESLAGTKLTPHQKREPLQRCDKLIEPMFSARPNRKSTSLFQAEKARHVGDSDRFTVGSSEALL
jgi:hypothetical protein